MTDSTIPAETIPAEWNAEPARWVEEHTDSLLESTDAILALFVAVDGIRLPLTAEGSTALSLIRLLEAIRTHLRYGARRQTEFLFYGALAVPSSPIGLQALMRLRDLANDIATGSIDAVTDADSALGRLLSAINIGSDGSAIIGRYRNVSEGKGASLKGIRLSVDLDPHIGTLPKGTVLPTSILTRTLVGREIDGDDIEEIRSAADLCVEGVDEFLTRFGVSHSVEGGSYECDSCGQTADSGCEDDTTIGYCEDFTLTEAMVEALDGHADGIRKHFADGSASDAEGWTEYLSENNYAQILKALAPKKGDKEDGIRYDATQWTFAVDFEALDGLKDLEFSELARLLPVLSKVATAYEAAGLLPPIPGKLTPAPTRYQSRNGDASFSWDPDTGLFSHAVTSSGVRLTIDARHGETRLELPSGEHVSIDRRTADNPRAPFVVRCEPRDAGENACLWFGVAHGEIQL